MTEPDEEITQRRFGRLPKGFLAAALVCALVAAAAVPLAWSNRDESLPIPGPVSIPDADPLKLVALGDSYTAGPGVLPYESGTADNSCFRSETAYPLIAGKQLDIETTSVACSGATTAALTTSYNGESPQQDALDGADIVVMTFGGNDVRALQTLAEDPLAAVAPEFLATFETQQLVPLAATLDAAYGQVRNATGPDPEVFVLGYPNLFPDNRADFQYCAGIQLPLGPAALSLPVENLHLLNARLNDTVRAATERAGFTFVDMAPWFDDRDICSDMRLIWGTVDPPAPEGGFHPSADGHRVMGDVLAGAIRSSGVLERN